MLKGIDISEWQQVGAGDKAKDFVICRSSYGVGYTDKNCDAHYQRAKSQGKLLGVYHYAYPQYNRAYDEAKWFLSQIQGYIHEAILILDLEENGLSVAWAKEFLDTVYNETGVRPLIYINEHTANRFDWSPVSNDYGLWIASWKDKFDNWSEPEPTESDFTANIGTWGFCALWQYTSGANTFRLDKDVAFMSREAWGKYANPAKSVAGSEPAQSLVVESIPTTNPEPEGPKEEPTTDEHVDSTPAVDDLDVEANPKKYNLFQLAINFIIELIKKIFKKKGN